jgi:flagellar protein FliL
MSDTETEPDVEEDAPSRFSAQDIIDMGKEDPEPKSKARLFILGGLVLIVGLIGGAYVLGFMDSALALLSDDQAVAEGPAAGGPSEVEVAKGPAIYFELPDFLVNMSKQGRGRSFLKVKLSLELADSSSIARVEMMMPRIQDKVQLYLRDMRMEDLQGTAAIHRLRLGLLDRVKNSVEPTPVRDVLFRELIIQ